MRLFSLSGKKFDPWHFIVFRVVPVVAAIQFIIETVPRFIAWLFNLPQPPTNEFLSVGEVYGIQVAVILFAFIEAMVLPRVAIPNQPEESKDEEAHRNALGAGLQFRAAWITLWGAWLVMYSSRLVGLPDQFPVISSFLWSTAGNVANAAFGALFFVLARPTHDTQRRFNPFRIYWVAAGSAVVVLAILEMMIAASIIQIGSPAYLILRGLEALCGGLAIALLVGRLESRRLGTRLWVVMMLYGYASIQFAQFFFDPTMVSDCPNSVFGPSVFQLVMTSVALPLKAILLLSFSGPIRSGRLYHYLLVTRTTRDNAELEWSAFEAGHKWD